MIQAWTTAIASFHAGSAETFPLAARVAHALYWGLHKVLEMRAQVEVQDHSNLRSDPVFKRTGRKFRWKLNGLYRLLNSQKSGQWPELSLIREGFGMEWKIFIFAEFIKIILGSFPFVPPPPRTLCTPQLQSTCHYIISIKWYVRLVGANNMSPLRGTNGNNPLFD